MTIITAQDALKMVLDKKPDHLESIMHDIKYNAMAGQKFLPVSHPLSETTKKTLTEFGYIVSDTTIDVNLLTCVFHIIQW